MAKGLMLVFSKPVSEEREDAYNKWYDNHHLQDITSVEGFVWGARYKLSERQFRDGASVQGLPYLAAYEVEADDPKSAIQNLLDARERVYREPDTLDYDTVLTVFFEEVTPPVRSKSASEDE